MILIPEKHTVLLKHRNPESILSLIPRSRLLSPEVSAQANGHNLAVYHGIEETKLLKNIGADIPAPMLSYYKWPGRFTPFDHQKTTAAFLSQHYRAFCLNTMGLGKSASALWAADYLMHEKVVKRVLIVSPLSTLERVWRNEVFQVLMHRTAVVLHGSRQRRLELLDTQWEFAVINFDGLKIIADEVAKRKDINLIIVDEASNGYRNASTSRYKTFKKMLQPWMRLWLMTGTPCPNAPTDAWAMAKLVNPGGVPEYFGSFQRLTMNQVTQFKWAPKVEGYKIAYDAMQPGIRFRKEDCLDLPPMTWQKRDCNLSTEQKDMYKQMHTLMETEAKTNTITAVNAADKINKLRQILCGSVKDTETGEYITLDFKPRLELLLECIEEAGAKVIVIVPFKGITYALEKEVSKHYSCAVLNGDVSVKKRNEIIGAFKESPDPHVLLCHPKVMSHGLTLTEADTMIFYAPIYSNDEAGQVVERINRPGQTRNMTIIQIGAVNLEWNIYNLVESRKQGQESILSLYKNELEKGSVK